MRTLIPQRETLIYQKKHYLNQILHKATIYYINPFTSYCYPTKKGSLGINSHGNHPIWIHEF